METCADCYVDRSFNNIFKVHGYAVIVYRKKKYKIIIQVLLLEYTGVKFTVYIFILKKLKRIKKKKTLLCLLEWKFEAIVNEEIDDIVRNDSMENETYSKVEHINDFGKK